MDNAPARIQDADMDHLTRFERWTDAVGGVRRAAAILSVDPGHVSRLRRGLKRPGLDLALRIERHTRGIRGGRIRASEWVAEPNEAA